MCSEIIPDRLEGVDFRGQECECSTLLTFLASILKFEGRSRVDTRRLFPQNGSLEPKARSGLARPASQTRGVGKSTTFNSRTPHSTPEYANDESLWNDGSQADDFNVVLTSARQIL